MAKTTKTTKTAAQKTVSCAWFARCTSPATGTTSHIVLGEVPTCDRCHKIATGQARSTAVEA